MEEKTTICPYCYKHFKTKAGRASHMKAKHGIDTKNEVKQENIFKNIEPPKALVAL